MNSKSDSFEAKSNIYYRYHRAHGKQPVHLRSAGVKLIGTTRGFLDDTITIENTATYFAASTFCK